VQIVDGKLLLFRTRTPHKYAMIPRCKVVNEPTPGLYEMAVKWSLDEVKVLRNLGVKNVPSPIQGTYEWPGRYKPFQHQIATSSFLTMNNRAYVFNEAGTGKTSACLWAADYLMKIGQVRRCLIVCPLSIMEAAWMKDIMTFVIHRKAAIAHASSMDKRKEIVAGPYEFVIINYDGVEGVMQQVKKCGDFDLVIADECNFVKNDKTRRWKALNAILTPDTRLWALTGTPAPPSLQAHDSCHDHAPAVYGTLNADSFIDVVEPIHRHNSLTIFMKNSTVIRESIIGLPPQTGRHQQRRQFLRLSNGGFNVGTKASVLARWNHDPDFSEGFNRVVTTRSYRHRHDSAFSSAMLDVCELNIPLAGSVVGCSCVKRCIGYERNPGDTFGVTVRNANAAITECVPVRWVGECLRLLERPDSDFDLDGACGRSSLAREIGLTILP